MIAFHYCIVLVASLCEQCLQEKQVLITQSVFAYAQCAPQLFLNTSF